MRRLVPFLALLAFLVAAAPAQAKTETRKSGDVQATVTYSGKNPPFRRARLTITQAGLTLFDGKVRMPRGCKPCGLQGEPGVMRLRDLDGDSEPEVLLDVFSGGAHCCSYSLVYRFVPFSNTYERIAQPWGNPGFVLRDLNRDRTPEFVTGDDRFSYLFTSYADTSWPIAIYRLDEDGFTIVTRRFRRAVRRDARRQLRIYRSALRQRRDVRGILAAYLADQYLARRSRQGWRVLRRAARRGQLKRPRGGIGPSGNRYLRSLRRYLRRFGYARRS